MKLKVEMAAIGAALAVAGVATGAHAATVQKSPADSAAAAQAAFGDTGSSAAGANAPRKSLQWNAKGRWGLKLDYQQPQAAQRDFQGQPFQSIDAGMTYRLTPQLHIGGAVGLTDQPQPGLVSPVQPQTPQPRVRLETTFKF